MAVLEIGRQIGRGGMAEVRLAAARGLGGFARLVVQKRILAHAHGDPAFERMFLDEARIAAELDHPGIVQILDVGRDADGLFLVMEYLSGENLAYVFQTLRRAGETLPWWLACRVGAQLAGALAAIHGAVDVTGRPRPIVHRDVTPSNVVACWNGKVKLVDFGIARALAATQTIEETVKGKLGYLAPEQAAGQGVDPRTDIFQLGIVLHELVTGARLFDGTSDAEKVRAVRSRPIPRPSAGRPYVPAALDAIILGALERDPERRTASAGEIRRALDELATTASEPAGEQDLGDWLGWRFAERRDERRRMERAALAPPGEIAARAPSPLRARLGSSPTEPPLLARVPPPPPAVRARPRATPPPPARIAAPIVAPVVAPSVAPSAPPPSPPWLAPVPPPRRYPSLIQTLIDEAAPAERMPSSAPPRRPRSRPAWDRLPISPIVAMTAVLVGVAGGLGLALLLSPPRHERALFDAAAVEVAAGRASGAASVCPPSPPASLGLRLGR